MIISFLRFIINVFSFYWKNSALTGYPFCLSVFFMTVLYKTDLSFYERFVRPGFATYFRLY
ncbi:hypothetical protein CLOSTASPAR_06563 [[Clostridium] asparagiforme DSM 15981]|uniref:Uncharacterized protein n=1 Tax=[Clostridium] asparagiforme DSM 15981 TaxID=518636 RepID=C0DBA8_9FIRM|nr:hypothetical protein CLOSTASPAR_06563 [[Clostridium] asparagiforme DSM 15981]